MKKRSRIFWIVGNSIAFLLYTYLVYTNLIDLPPFMNPYLSGGFLILVWLMVLRSVFILTRDIYRKKI